MHNTKQLKDGHELKGLRAVCRVQRVYRVVCTGRRIQGGGYRVYKDGWVRLRLLFSLLPSDPRRVVLLLRGPPST